jgi:hypothetical protein
MATVYGVREAADEFIDQQFDDIGESERAVLLSDELFGTLALCVDELKTQRFYGDEVDAEPDRDDRLSGKVNRGIDDLQVALYERRDQLLDDDTAES